jgi:hypothetical protein
MPITWAEAIEADALKVEGLDINVSGGTRTNKPALIARAFRAIAADTEFDKGNVYKQRRTPGVVAEDLDVDMAERLYDALRKANLRTVVSISMTFLKANNTYQVTIILKDRPS